MADTKTSALTELAPGAVVDGDYFLVLDTSDTTQGAGGSLKKIGLGGLQAAANAAALNDIGAPGKQGFGVGIAPTIPSGYAAMAGTYDKGRSLVAGGTTDGKENVYAEIYRTAFGYVGQFYFIADDGTTTLYQVSVSGADGAFSVATGIDRPAALTGNESVDFPKNAKEWYAINGSTITGVTSEGKSVSFEYVPSENEG